MKKKLLVFISCIVLSLTLAAGVTFAFFDGSVRKSADFAFGKLDVSSTVTQEAGAVFTKAGQTSTVALNVSAGAETAPFRYAFTVSNGAATEPDFASSVLVWFDGDYLGTAAQLFNGEFTLSPDRYLTKTETAAHELKLEYHLGAGAFHKNKRLDLSVTCTAWTAEANKVAFVSNADEFSTLMRDAQAGKLAPEFRIVLTQDLTLPAASSTTPITLDLNGHALHTALTLAGAGKSRIVSAAPAALDSLLIDHAGAYVELSGSASVSAATIAQADTEKQAGVMAAYARDVLSAGLGASSVDALGAYRVFDGADLIAVSGVGYANGVVTPTQKTDEHREILRIGAQEILYTVYGTGALDDAGANLSELAALMDVQLKANGEAKTVAYDLLLPTVLASGARVEWRSSDAATISAAGKYTPGSSDLTLTLTAYLRFNGKTAVKEFAVKIKNSKDKAAILREILDAYGSVDFGELGEKYYLPTQSANVAAQKADPAYANLSSAEKAKMDAVNLLIAESGIQDFAYTDADKLIADGHLSYVSSVDSLELVTATGIHRTMLTVKAVFPDGEIEDSLAVYINVASVAEAMRYLTAVAEDYGNIAENFRKDRFHRIDAYGNDRSQYEPSAGNGVYTFHGDATAENFGRPTALGASVREGSFVLPDRYTNMSGAMANSAGEKVYYYFYYHFDDTAFFAENDLPGVTAIDRSYIALGADAGVPEAEINLIPDFNNFFLVDPAKLPTNSTTINLQVGLYKKTGETLTLEGTIQNVALPIPGAVHNDSEGFEDKWVFDRAVSMLRADPIIEYVACPLAPLDTLLQDLCEDASSFILNTSEDATPPQITGEMKGLSAYVNIETLSLVGNADKMLFSSSAVTASMGDALQNLKKLTALTLNYCGISMIDPIKSLPQLRTLNLAHNPLLDDISAAVALMHLTNMDVSYCGFNFIGILSFESPYPEVSVFEAICSADRSTAVEIVYGYKESSSSTEIKTAVYAAKFADITDHQIKAKQYLAKFDFLQATAFDKMDLPLKILGVTDARFAYRVLGTANMKWQGSTEWDTSDYTPAVYSVNTDTWSGAIPTAAKRLYVISPGANSTVVAQVIVILTDSSGRDIPGAYYCSNFAVTFLG